MVRFRLLHLSDFHFGRNADVTNLIHRAALNFEGISDVDIDKLVPRSPKQSLIKPTSHDTLAAFGVAKFCYEQKDNYDAVIVTGDLATTGRRADIQFASDFISKRYSESFFDFTGTKYSLAGNEKDCFVIPGNHDRYTSTLGGGPGSVEFDNIFKIFPGASRVYSKILRKKGGSCGLVFADFSLKKRRDVKTAQLAGAELLKGIFGRGNVYNDVLSDLKAETTRLRHVEPGVCIIWAIHFAPYDVGDSLEFQDYPKLLAAAKELNVRLLLCGHTHTRSLQNWDGIHIVCAGTACANDENPTHLLHIVDIRLDQGRMKLKHEDYLFSPDDGEFRRHKS
ncbi:MAG: metallophosphoesterase [Mesorhizobium sp.]|uniref:metallophosphoesterase family protein n=1 Tax=Mesorhizobium sp. TaxID=1871066 RepID=UPI0012228BDD|nr:metallophosphoesterase [Mesorhizobium sp.]TIR15329.1 MAG: metallophosphoesterase [Mesorhizobium sp.]